MKLHTVGLILMVVGGIGLLLSLFWLVSRPRRGTIVRDDYY